MNQQHCRSDHSYWIGSNMKTASYTCPTWLLFTGLEVTSLLHLTVQGYKSILMPSVTSHNQYWTVQSQLSSYKLLRLQIWRWHHCCTALYRLTDTEEQQLINDQPDIAINLCTNKLRKVFVCIFTDSRSLFAPIFIPIPSASRDHSKVWNPSISEYSQNKAGLLPTNTTAHTTNDKKSHKTLKNKWDLVDISKSCSKPSHTTHVNYKLFSSD